MEKPPKSIGNQTFQERILSSSSLNNQLISRLSTTSDASRELRETNIYITDLQARIEIGTKNLRSLRWKVEKLRSEYEGLRDGSTNRFFSKLAGRIDDFAARTLRAEQEYEAAFEEQAKVNKDVETYKQSLEEAQRSLPHLEEQAALHAATESELEELYTSIFSLPHADYPQEATANQEIASLQVPISNLQKQIDTESQALKLLINARKCIIWCHGAILNAQDTDSNFKHASIEARDMGNNIMRNAMNTAQLYAVQAEVAYNAAQAVQPSIQDMSSLKILEEKGLIAGASYGTGKVIRLLDLREMRARVKECGAEMGPAIEGVAREVATAKRRVAGLGEEKGELDKEARDVLRRARGEILTIVVEGRGAGAEVSEATTQETPVEPPSYSP